jgi:hypothetical protein
LQKYVIDGHYTDVTKAISSAGAAQTLGGSILVIFDNANAISPSQPTGFTEWPSGSGHTVSRESIIGKYTFIGDMDLDGKITASDYARVSLDIDLPGHPGMTAGATYFDGDMNFDGKVTAEDFTPLDLNFISGVRSFAPVIVIANGEVFASAASGSSPVPEPSSLWLLGAGALLARRRRGPRMP